jgi:Rps23 Pro-64 3,4-dihydroxylase Tpa1-like proline 4-hydroxylase
MTVSRGLMPPWLVRRDLLSPDECRGLLGWALDNEARFRPAALDKGLVDPAIRHSLSLRDLGPFSGLFEDRVRAMVPELIDQLRVTPFVVAAVELELVAHNDGAHFALHGDLYTGQGSARGDRMLSAVYYFHRAPKAFSGGCLRLHRIGAVPGGMGPGEMGVDIAPDQNSLAVFPSWAPHEVLTVHCPSGAFGDSRFAVNCWVYRAGERAGTA